MYYIFIIVLSICLVPVIIAQGMLNKNADDDDKKEDQQKFRSLLAFTIALVILGSVSLMYLVRRIHWLLILKDIELRHQSTK